MNNPNRPEESMTDAELMRIAKTVEPEDFRRVDPSPQVWTGVLIETRDLRLRSNDIQVIESSNRFSPAAMLQSTVLRVAAAVVLIVGVGSVIFTQRDTGPSEMTLATAAMNDEGLPISTESQAWATVVCEGEECRVKVEFTSVPEPGGDALELWVIDAEVAKMHSLGVITGSGSFPLPVGVGPDGFPIIDISVEPKDGVETHSGQSVLRGTFERL